MMNPYKLGWRLSLTIVLVVTLREHCDASEIYLSPNGDDQWFGKLDAPNPSKTDGPLATLEEANSRVRQLLKAGTKGPITVRIPVGNVAYRNYVHDLGGDRGYIRLDDHSGATAIIEHVGVNVRFMFVLKGPCEFRNNFAIHARGFSNGIRTETRLEQSVFYADCGKPNLKKKGGGYFFDDSDRVSNSLVFAPQAIEAKYEGQDMVPQERRGSAAVGMLYNDPMFDEEAMKQKIFRFKPGSPAEELGD